MEISRAAVAMVREAVQNAGHHIGHGVDNHAIDTGAQIGLDLAVLAVQRNTLRQIVFLHPIDHRLDLLDGCPVACQPSAST